MKTENESPENVTDPASNIPRHVAIIMDGNRRWAEARGLDVSEGHYAGFENLTRVVAHLSNRGVEHLTVYAFSTENWDRPESEVNGILDLAIAVIAREARKLHQNGIQIKHLGRVDRLSLELRTELENAVEMTADNAGLILGIAFDYGGRAEIVDAVRRLIEHGALGSEIDENKFSEYLYTANMPDVDLLIRTGGDLRISNFLLWQTAYSEFYSSEIWWPDFDGEHIDAALNAFGVRQRRFGKRV
jgi:undecaprenyl diphosphate synthase